MNDPYLKLTIINPCKSHQPPSPPASRQQRILTHHQPVKPVLPFAASHQTLVWHQLATVQDVKWVQLLAVTGEGVQELDGFAWKIRT